MTSPDWYQIKHYHSNTNVRGSGYDHDESTLARTRVVNKKKDRKGLVKAITTFPDRYNLYREGNVRYETGLFSNQDKYHNKIETMRGLLGNF